MSRWYCRRRFARWELTFGAVISRLSRLRRRFMPQSAPPSGGTSRKSDAIGDLGRDSGSPGILSNSMISQEISAYLHAILSERKINLPHIIGLVILIVLGLFSGPALAVQGSPIASAWGDP